MEPPAREVCYECGYVAVTRSIEAAVAALNDHVAWMKHVNAVFSWKRKA